MNTRAAIASCLALVLAGASETALAHRAPNSFVELDVGTRSVIAQIRVPESELEFAMIATDRAAALPAYLRQHVAVETPEGTPWKLVVLAVRRSVYFDHDYFVADLELTPPAGASARKFVLIDDAVTHEVRNHVVIVTQRGVKPRVLGVLQYPVRRLAVVPSTYS